jgi:predicted nucleic acid-binding protein
MSVVLDASVFVSAISPQERHHAEARAMFDSIPDDTPFLVPSVFRLEVVAALARRGEAAPLLDSVDALVRGPRFHSFPIDSNLLNLAVQMGRHARLRAYDAVYCALAVLQSAPLFTLDVTIRENVAAAYPGLEVAESAALIGSLKGKLEIRGDIVTTGSRWEADS